MSPPLGLDQGSPECQPQAFGGHTVSPVSSTSLLACFSLTFPFFLLFLVIAQAVLGSPHSLSLTLCATSSLWLCLPLNPPSGHSELISGTMQSISALGAPELFPHVSQLLHGIGVLGTVLEPPQN